MKRGTLFGHPKGLSILYLTGLWEILAIFGSRTILVYYLVQDLNYSQGQAIQIYSLASGGSAVLYLLGGTIADRYLGLQRAVIWGASIMAIGHVFLIVQPLLFPGLFIIALGNGLMKPPLIAQIGLLYHPDDARRDRAFTHYKVGCNIGAMLAPIVCGTVGEIWGWSWGFVVSAVGMVIALITYLFGRHLLPSYQLRLKEEANTAPSTGTMPRHTLPILGLVLIGGAIFWSAYNQLGGSIAFWLFDSVNREVNWDGQKLVVPATWFQSVNPLMIFVFAPLVNLWWGRHESRASTRSHLYKMFLGTMMLAGSFAILACAVWIAGPQQTSWIWVIVALAPLTLAELYVDPIAQSLFTRLAPARMVAIFASLWFVSYALGWVGAGWLGQAWTDMGPANFFAVVAIITCLGAALTYAARWFHR